MQDDVEPDKPRRLFLSAALALGAAALTKSVHAEAVAALPRPRRTGRRFGPLKQIHAGPLNVTYAEEGPPDGPPVLLLHGWPYDILTYEDAAAHLADQGYRVIVPYLRGYGPTRFRSSGALRNGQPAALATDAIALLDALHIDAAVIGGCDWGARTANIVAALWPGRCKALVSVSGYLIGSREAGAMPLAPEAELSWWYQFYFATDRGHAGYARNTEAFARLIWRLASPQWSFGEETFRHSATSLTNPDHVEIVIHNYRWRLGLADGERQYDEIERRLAEAPDIQVPTITLEGDANGAPHPDAAVYARKFVGRYAHRVATGGIGHNLPQEAPEFFARSIIDAGGL